ncbi:hypothetical protein TWF569_004037 [Orbilia oligospora]|nr:hypothetical protein TWF103_011935 [Orbilia oligospora]KAF3091146.1 hypothetical protein TWF706_009632 [Orbilia oligospora]KAF3094147.1 hypothetical protein TWF102_007653 [Orbilia oligospora]KAF3138693.1 hypothetical protein TWF594_006884 [Orbilia oligospora]KAF3157134.1 hypothetical protein TWF569_004037 [Orbilia oligospora]
MADAPDTKVPILVRLNSRARLLSYTVKEDITAPAQYYPYSIPRSKKPESESTGDATNLNDTATSHVEENDRSIIIYGTKKGLTILYPRRCRLSEGVCSPRSTNEESFGTDGDGDMDMDVHEGGSAIPSDLEGKLPEEPPRKKTYTKAPKYESDSEPEDYSIQKNARFPWKFLVELGSPVIEFAVPGPSHSAPEYNYLEFLPWLEKMYLTAITADGKVHLIILPLRLPPPGVSSNQLGSNDFPVHTMLLSPRKLGQIRLKGICVDFMRRLQTPNSP